MPKNKEYSDPNEASLDRLSSILTGCLRSDHEIQVLKYLFEKYNCRSVSDEAKNQGVQRQTIYNRIKSGQVATLETKNQTFVIF